MSVANGAEYSSDFDDSPITHSDDLSVSSFVTSIAVVLPYLFRLAAFHFAQRVR
jgi:hypothetical protein